VEMPGAAVVVVFSVVRVFLWSVCPGTIVWSASWSRWMVFSCVSGGLLSRGLLSGGLYAKVSFFVRLQTALFLSVWVVGIVNATFVGVGGRAPALRCVAGKTAKVGTNVSVGAEDGSVASAECVRGMHMMSQIP
jgi:hypothetical protein